MDLEQLLPVVVIFPVLLIIGLAIVNTTVLGTYPAHNEVNETITGVNDTYMNASANTNCLDEFSFGDIWITNGTIEFDYLGVTPSNYTAYTNGSVYWNVLNSSGYFQGGSLSGLLNYSCTYTPTGLNVIQWLAILLSVAGLYVIVKLLFLGG